MCVQTPGMDRPEDLVQRVEQHQRKLHERTAELIELRKSLRAVSPRSAVVVGFTVFRESFSRARLVSVVVSSSGQGRASSGLLGSA